MRTQYDRPSLAVSERYLDHPLVRSTLHILRELCVGSGLRLVPVATDTVPDAERMLYDRLVMLDTLDLALRHLADASLLGASAVEIVWGEDYFPLLLRPIPAGAYRIGLDASSMPTEIEVQTGAGLQTLPVEHVLIYISNPDLQYPAGRPIVQQYKRYLDAYDSALRALQLYVQRHGAPTVFAQLPSIYTDEEVSKVYDALTKMQDALVGVIPASADAKIEFLEPEGTGMTLSLQLLELLERLFVRSVLGSVLAVYEAQYGTRAQAQVHWDVMRRLIEGMQRPLERAINRQLWQRVVGLHLGAPQSRLELNEPSLIPRESVLRNLGDLTALGIIDPQADRDWLRAMIATDMT